jgi:hypothetical protein
MSTVVTGRMEATGSDGDLPSMQVPTTLVSALLGYNAREAI